MAFAVFYSHWRPRGLGFYFSRHFGGGSGGRVTSLATIMRIVLLGSLILSGAGFVGRAGLGMSGDAGSDMATFPFPGLCWPSMRLALLLRSNL